MPKLRTKVPLDATRIPVSRSKGQRSPSPGPLMLTHIVRHIIRAAYKLPTWCTDGGRRPASATGAMTSKVKGQGRNVT